MDEIVTIGEAATFLNKHPDTVRRWIKTSKLKAKHVAAGGSGIYVMLRSDLLESIYSASQSRQNEHKKKLRSPRQESLQDQLPM